MIKYIQTEGGVKDQETGACIPICKGNRHYQEYLEWLKLGNTPIVKQPSEFHKLVGDEWVLDSEAKNKANQEVLIQAKIRDLAIDSLKASGDLPIDYKKIK